MKKQHQVEVEWKNNLSFNIGVDEHLVVLDGADESKGLCPKPLMLASLGGCTAMDVVTILKESRTKFKKFDVQVTGELSREKPQTYTKVNLTYNFEGADLDKEKIRHAVALSVDEQCGVLIMFRKFAEVSYEINFSNP
jgi:putative redox protein